MTFRQWLPQRRRWIKGWMQTVALCLGRGIPPGLRLPLRQQLAVHGILTAGVLGLLLYPASLCVIAARDRRRPRAAHSPTGVWRALLLALNLGNVAAVLVAAVVSALRGLAAARMRASRLAHSAAAALLGADVARRLAGALPVLPSARRTWEKTAHGVARDRRTPRTSRVRSSVLSRLRKLRSACS